MLIPLKTFAKGQAKTRALEDTGRRIRDRDGELEEALRQKEEELEIYKTGMDSTLLQLKELQLVTHSCWMMLINRLTPRGIKPSTVRLMISSKNTSRS